jgi:hypothetical protein
MHGRTNIQLSAFDRKELGPPMRRRLPLMNRMISDGLGNHSGA